MAGSGAVTVGVNYPKPMGLTVTNYDLVRFGFFDVERPGGGQRRQLVDPGQTFDCQIAAGPATITFGPGVDYTFVDPEGGE